MLTWMLVQDSLLLELSPGGAHQQPHLVDLLDGAFKEVDSGVNARDVGGRHPSGGDRLFGRW